MSNTEIVVVGAGVAGLSAALAVAGTGALLLGAATDALRQSGMRLALQNAKLANANQRLDQLAQQLATAARRNLREKCLFSLMLYETTHRIAASASSGM